MVKPRIRVNLSIPQHKELARGTLRALIRNAGLTVDEFFVFLYRYIKINFFPYGKLKYVLF
jgi:hypothetical protein